MAPLTQPLAADTAIDALHMHRAIRLAQRGWGRVQPNPLVGAVVVSAAGDVVGEGWHAEYGQAHAETEALDRAGPSASGGTLYVTLEPCGHHGKTPPCTDAIVRSGIARVVVAVRDPNPVAAGGLEHLSALGIDVVAGVAAREADDLNAAFLHWHRTGTPYVALKYAMSLDGRLSIASDRATAVTGAEANAEVQRLRAGFDAILIGSRTALVDDPRLTVRGPVQPRTPPLRVVLDSDLALPATARLIHDIGRAPALVVAAHDARGDARPLEDRGVRVARAPRAPGGGLDLQGVMRELAAADIRSVLCEGGGRLGSALLGADLVARQYLFLAPLLLGDAGPAAYTSLAHGAAGRRWRNLRTERFGDDVLLELARD